MATRTFCDCCNKEIPDGDPIGSITVSFVPNLMGETADSAENYDLELCSDCFNSERINIVALLERPAGQPRTFTEKQVRELQDTILLGRLWKDAVDKWDHVKQCFDKFLKEE